MIDWSGECQIGIGLYQYRDTKEGKALASAGKTMVQLSPVHTEKL